MSIWQTKKWQEMLKESGQVSDFFEVDSIFVEKRKVAMGEYGLFVLGIENELTEENVKNLTKLCEKEEALFIQFETLNYKNNAASFSGRGREFKREGNNKLNSGHYKKFITPYTAVIDLEQTTDEILSNMKSKGRYNIRLAKKKGVETFICDKTDENIREYYDLMQETTSRDNFAGNNFEYYKTFLNKLENSKLILAKVEDKVVAGGIFLFEKDISIYYYGASTSDKKYRNLMAPYLLQWEAIVYGKSIDSKIYDFLGVAGPGEKKSSLSGVTDFKMKLTSDIRKVSKSSIFINKKFKYFLISILRKLKK